MGRMLKGVVTGESGRPVARVELALVRPGVHYYLENGLPPRGHFPHVPVAKTGENGAYELPPQVGAFVVVAAGEAGCAKVDGGVLGDGRITLHSWATARAVIHREQAEREGGRAAPS